MTTEAPAPAADRLSPPGSDGRVVSIDLLAVTKPDGADGATSSLVKLGHDEWNALCADLEHWVDAEPPAPE